MIWKFWRLVRISIKLQLTYRIAMIAGLATNVFWGFFRIYLVIALFGSVAEVNGLSESGAITYLIFSQGLISMLNVFGSYEIARSVDEGQVSNQLLRPMNLFIYWLGYYLGRSMVTVVIRGLVLILILSPFFTIVPPDSLIGFMLFLGSLSAAWLVCHAWIFLINLAAFWTPQANGILRMTFATQQLLAGMLLPLRLFPEWFQKICAATPFPSMLNTPIEVYLGLYSHQEALQTIAVQMAWAVILIFMGQVVMRLGVRKLVIQGG